MKKVLFFLLISSLIFANVKFWDGDNIESKGLNGPVKDSLGYRVNEIEKHIHNREIWYGAGAGNGTGVSTSITAWVLTASPNANTYGDFVQLGTGQIAISDFPGTTYFDIHAIFVTDVNDLASTYMVEIWSGTGTTANATLMTQFPYRAAGNATQSTRQEIKSIRIPVGYKSWARVKCAVGGKTLSMLVGLHLYPGI